jgi:hypothetical protein
VTCDDLTKFCDEMLDEHSIYAFMHGEAGRLFFEEDFADQRL